MMRRLGLATRVSEQLMRWHPHTAAWGWATAAPRRARVVAGAAVRSLATRPGKKALRPGQDRKDAPRKHYDGTKSHSEEHERSANEMAAPFYKGVTLAMVAAAGCFVLPGTMTSSVPHSARLCASKDVFLQRSGVSRMAMIAANQSMHKHILLEAIDPLVGLLRRSEDEEILEKVLDVVVAVATNGADDDRELMTMDGALEAVQQLAANTERSDAIRAKAEQAGAKIAVRDGSVSNIALV